MMWLFYNELILNLPGFNSQTDWNSKLPLRNNLARQWLAVLQELITDIILTGMYYRTRTYDKLDLIIYIL